ncbi:hypothetical protein EV121DRAFT_216248 [Schizophyllum commune]
MWSARAALLFTLLLALGARAAPAGEPDREWRGVTLQADLHPGLLAFGPAATVVLAREGEEEGLAGVPLLGRSAVMSESNTRVEVEGTEVRGKEEDAAEWVFVAEDDGQQRDPSGGGDAPSDDDTPEDDLVQPKAHPSRRGIVGIVLLSLYVDRLLSSPIRSCLRSRTIRLALARLPFHSRQSSRLSLVLPSVTQTNPPPRALLLALFLAAYPPARRWTTVYARTTCSRLSGVASRIHLPSALSHIHLPSSLASLTLRAHPPYQRIGEKVGSLFPAKPFGALSGSSGSKLSSTAGSKLSRTAESKLVRWAEEDMGLDDLESDHFLNEDVADEDLELADGEYIPLRAAKGRARVYGTVSEGERKAVGRRWWR